MGELNLSSEEKSASFNEALNMIMRLDVLIKRVQDAKVNPFQLHIEFGVPNFELRIASLESHWKEVEPYCNDKEVEHIARLRNVIEHDKRRMIKKRRDTIEFDLTVYQRLDKMLSILESAQRRYQFAHGLSNPLKQFDLGL